MGQVESSCSQATRGKKAITEVVVLYVFYRSWFNAGVMLIGVNVIIAGYLIGYLSWIKKLPPDEWDSVHPLSVPVATLAFVTGAFW